MGKGGAGKTGYRGKEPTPAAEICPNLERPVERYVHTNTWGSFCNFQTGYVFIGIPEKSISNTTGPSVNITVAEKGLLWYVFCGNNSFGGNRTEIGCVLFFCIWYDITTARAGCSGSTRSIVRTQSMHRRIIFSCTPTFFSSNQSNRPAKFDLALLQKQASSTTTRLAHMFPPIILSDNTYLQTQTTALYMAKQRSMPARSSP